MPIDTTRMARSLLSDDDREIIDRTSMLPIGQYEDGSLTPAIPGAAMPLVDYGRGQFEQGDNTDLMQGFPAATHLARTLMDPWGTAKDVVSSGYDFLLRPSVEGAVRSLVAQEGPPIFDDGGRYVSGANMQPLDAFNAASIGPMSGIAGRVAGAIPKLGSGSSDILTKVAEEPVRMRAYHWSPDAADIGPDSNFNPFSHFGSPKAAADRYNVMSEADHPGGGTIPVDIDVKNPLRIGDLGYHTPVRIAAAVDYAMDPKYLDSWGSSPLVRQVANSSPAEAARLVDEAIKARGYDGLVYRNHSEDKGADSFIATRPGSVRSAFTGETLYANPTEASLPSLLELAAHTEDRPQEYRDNPMKFGPRDAFDRWNDPWGEVPEIINNPFGYPPLPDLPESPQPRKRFIPRG